MRTRSGRRIPHTKRVRNLTTIAGPCKTTRADGTVTISDPLTPREQHELLDRRSRRRKKKGATARAKTAVNKQEPKVALKDGALTTQRPAREQALPR